MKKLEDLLPELLPEFVLVPMQDLCQEEIIAYRPHTRRDRTFWVETTVKVIHYRPTKTYYLGHRIWERHDSEGPYDSAA